jgi:cation diffusion facilitator family transporter
MTEDNNKIAMRVSYVSIIINVLLSLIKFLAGIFGRSAAMVSDAVHSLSDVLSTIVVIVGVRISGKASDADHQYGHERMECVAAVILATLLFIVGLGIGWAGIQKIVSKAEIAVPSVMALVAAVLSIALKEGMYWYTRAAAVKVRSDALMADAWHHRSDALSSIGSLVGIGGAMLGFPILDPIASVVICLFIVKVSFEIFKDATDKMVDKACDDETIEAMKNVISGIDGVKGLDLIHTRLFGSKIYVDIEISADGELNLKQAHGIAENVHHTIEEKFADVKHCMVHVNPR